MPMYANTEKIILFRPLQELIFKQKSIDFVEMMKNIIRRIRPYTIFMPESAPCVVSNQMAKENPEAYVKKLYAKELPESFEPSNTGSINIIPVISEDRLILNLKLF